MSKVDVGKGNKRRKSSCDSTNSQLTSPSSLPPENKKTRPVGTVEMAEADKKDIGQQDLYHTMLEIKKELKDLGCNLRKSIDQKFDNISSTFKETLSKEFGEMRDHVDLEVGRLEKKIEQLEIRVGSIEERDYVDRSKQFDPDLTIVAINLNEELDEIIEEKIADLFNVGLGIRDLEPVRVKRLKGKEGKSGVVKIELPRKEDKIRVLRAKTKLKECRDFKRVYLRSSMTHTERIMQQNFQEILNDLPNGNKFRLTGNGKIIRKVEEPENVPRQGMSNGRGRGSIRGRGRGRVRND